MTFLFLDADFPLCSFGLEVTARDLTLNRIKLSHVALSLMTCTSALQDQRFVHTAMKSQTCGPFAYLFFEAFPLLDQQAISSSRGWLFIRFGDCPCESWPWHTLVRESTSTCTNNQQMWCFYSKRILKLEQMTGKNNNNNNNIVLLFFRIALKV